MRKPLPIGRLSDGDLLRLSKNGDEEAFLTLYRRQQGAVFRFALHMSGSLETAEEVTQEVFLALLSNAQGYVPERGSLEAFLIGIARNQVRKQLRLFPAGASGGSEQMTELGRHPGDQVLDELSKDEELSALRTAILALPPKYREVVVLCDLEEGDYEGAAERLGCAVGTVRSRLHRARAILQAKLRRRERCPA